jgi:hypothetical protein
MTTASKSPAADDLPAAEARALAAARAHDPGAEVLAMHDGVRWIASARWSRGRGRTRELAASRAAAYHALADALERGAADRAPVVDDAAALAAGGAFAAATARARAALLALAPDAAADRAVSARGCPGGWVATARWPSHRADGPPRERAADAYAALADDLEQRVAARDEAVLEARARELAAAYQAHLPAPLRVAIRMWWDSPRPAFLQGTIRWAAGPFGEIAACDRSRAEALRALVAALEHRVEHETPSEHPACAHCADDAVRRVLAARTVRV